jgi:hypothetical protein
MVVFALFGVIFGGLHCVGWSFEFPTHTEQTLWRSTSLAITAIPLIVATNRLLIGHSSAHSRYQVLRKIRTNRSSDFGSHHDHPTFHLCPRPFIPYCPSACFAEEPTAECSDRCRLDKIPTSFVLDVIPLYLQFAYTYSITKVL